MKPDTYIKRIASVDSKIKALQEKREALVKGWQSICIHLRVERTGGEEWWDPLERDSHGWNPYRHRCKECGLTGFSRGTEEDKRIYEMLRRD